MRVLTDWLLTPARAAVHLPTRTAVVADLHLGYGEARRAAGESVPVRRVADELAPLRPMFAEHRVCRLVIAGDLFEAGPSREIAADLLEWLAAVDVELAAVVPGNHDRDLTDARLPVHAAGCTVGDWHIVHGDAVVPPGRIVQGHEHPWMRWGGRLEAPCYLVGRTRLILPAFSADAAGANVLRDPRWAAYRCCAIAGTMVLDFGEIAALMPSGKRT